MSLSDDSVAGCKQITVHSTTDNTRSPSWALKPRPLSMQPTPPLSAPQSPGPDHAAPATHGQFDQVEDSTHVLTPPPATLKKRIPQSQGTALELMSRPLWHTCKQPGSGGCEETAQNERWCSQRCCSACTMPTFSEIQAARNGISYNHAEERLHQEAETEGLSSRTTSNTIDLVSICFLFG